MSAIRSQKVAWALTGVVALGLLASTGIGHAEVRGQCTSAVVNEPFRLPNGIVAAAGEVTLCTTVKYSPVQWLHKTYVNGRAVGQSQLTTGNWRPYFLEVELTPGSHQLQLAFVNDLNQAGEDRNLMLDQVTFYRAQD